MPHFNPSVVALGSLLGSLLGPGVLGCKSLPPKGAQGSRISTPVNPALPGQSTDATLSPYFWVGSPEAGVDALPLKSTRVRADVSGVIADVKVVQVYRNEGKNPLEAVYVFPGSTRAAVYGMKMTLGERVIQAQIREKEQARRDYEQARQEGRSASLLEQHRPNVFQMNVANIMPGDEIRVELSYTELLVPQQGIYEFVYPTVVGPRYSNTPIDQAKNDEKWVASPYTKEGQAPLSTFDIQVNLAAGMPIQGASCATHKTAIQFPAPDQATVRLDASEGKGGNRDFILQYRLAGGRIQSGLMLSKGRDENFFLLQVQPPKVVTSAVIPPREYVFIMDVSGSMNGFPIETSKALLEDLVSHLRPEDRFNVLVFESGSALWSPEGSRPASEGNLRNALAFIHSQNGGGGTEIVSALKRALALPKTVGFSRSFVIATDGYISVEPKVLDVVRQNLGEANLFAFGIGSSVNRFLIEGMAHAGMGEPFIVTNPEAAPAQAERLRQYIASPVLTNVKVTFQGFEAYDVEPTSIPDVLSERPVICFGKWKGEASGTVVVTGRTAEGAFRQSFPVSGIKPQESDAALRNLWARHRIQLLGDYAGLGDGKQQEAITELGLKYGLLTNFTSFVAIDSQVRNASGHTDRVDQPLPMPQGVSNAAVGSPSLVSAKVAAGPMPMVVPDCAPSMGMARDRKTKVFRLEERSSGQRLSEPPMDAEVEKAPVPSVSALLAEIRLRLNTPAMAALVAKVAPGTVMELRVDAGGKVLSLSFSQPFEREAEVRKMVLSWTFQGWKSTALTTVRYVF